MTEWNVARYLAARLRQLGVRHVFGVPGNHLGGFLHEIHRHADEPEQPWHLEWIGEPSELVAGYAADGYARVNGIAAAAVTYSVGSFSLLTPVGGSYVELLPVVVINGAPSYEAHLNFDKVGLLTSHMSPRRDANIDVYRQVTVAAEIISNPRVAPWQIDSVLMQAITRLRPVYLEVWEDAWEMACDAPVGTLERLERPSSCAPKTNCALAVDAAMKLIRDMPRPELIFWGGEELVRFGVTDVFRSLVEKTQIQFATTIMGKTLLSEYHPKFVGIYNGNASDPLVRRIFESAPCRIGLGAWTTSKNLEGMKVWEKSVILAAEHGVRINQSYFPNVELGPFMQALERALSSGEAEYRPFDFFAEAAAVTESDRDFFARFLAAPATPLPLTYDSFFQRMNQFVADATTGEFPDITCPYNIVSDAGFALLGSQIIRMPEPQSFFSQTSWLAIGYSAGGATGIKVARPDRRMLVFIGDGSFQETCQALSSQTHLRHDTVVFVLNNGNFYGIEQMLVDSCYYAGKAEPHYYNELHPWNVDKLAEVFGSEEYPMTGYRVANHGELDDVLAAITDPASAANRGPIVVQVVLPVESYPKAIQYKVDQCKA